MRPLLSEVKVAFPSAAKRYLFVSLFKVNLSVFDSSVQFGSVDNMNSAPASA